MPLTADEARRLLPGNVPAALAAARTLGPVDAQAPMVRMILALKLAPEAQARLARQLAEIQDPRSPGYHRWRTPAQFGAEFGPAPEALARVTAWLQAGGFQVEEEAAGRGSIVFSGTVRQVERAFRTPIRSFMLDGRRHQGNLQDPSIPDSLADVVEGVVSLHNLRHRAMNQGFRPVALASAGTRQHHLTPGDFATIYHLKPLYQAGIDGSGVSIAVVGRAPVEASDLATFRHEFGLPARAPEILRNGPAPNDQDSGENGEAALDVEWSGAVAPNASIRFVLSGSTDSTDGVDLSARYAVEHNLAPVLSLSFGQCETTLGATERAFFRNLWAQAALQGISVLVSSGDNGPAGCDSPGSDQGTGRAVSGLASTPFNLAVGGTQFHEDKGRYWSDRPGPDQASALRYIPEQAWNESGSAGGSGLWASSGGLSAFYPKPAWQVAKGVPGDSTFRCLPDVALSAAGGHDGYLVVTGGDHAVVGGTSCSAPAFAGILALVVQKTGERQGNPGPALYTLGNAQYQGTGPEVFHDITTGDTSVPGIPGYASGPGYDLATGLGSVDAQALVTHWSRGQGNNVDARILAPATDRTVPSGSRVVFRGAGQESRADLPLNYAWSFGDGAQASGAATAHVFRNAGSVPAACTVSFTARDSTGAQGTDTRTLTVLPVPAPGELILDGGFEAGGFGWTARGVTVGATSGRDPAHSGQGDAWFDGWHTAPEVLAQRVRIPAQAASVQLTFWVHVETLGDAPGPVDCLQVKVGGPGQAMDARRMPAAQPPPDAPVIVATISNRDAADDYQLHRVDLARFRGREILLTFVAENRPDGVNTAFALDDVSLVAR
jgi:hypothetical protein